MMMILCLELFLNKKKKKKKKKKEEEGEEGEEEKVMGYEGKKKGMFVCGYRSFG